MMKRVMSMLMVMVLMVSVLSVSAFAVTCADNGSTCAASTTWNSSATEHWLYCTNGCDNKIELGAHDWAKYGYDETNHWGVCSVCEKADATVVSHSFTTMKSDANGHWNECVCGAKEAAVAHSDTNGDMVCDACGNAHVCKLETKYDADYHWEACADASCTATPVVKASHSLVESGTKKTCSACDYSEHVHVWASEYSTDGEYHWYDCTDKCGETKGMAMHYDHNSTGTCDVCDKYISEKTMMTLTVTGLTEPTEGAAVDFTASVAEDRFGTPDIYWNRVVNLSANTSVSLGKTNTYAAGTMYNTSILVPMNSKDVVSDDIKITLNGKEVPYYTTNAAYQNAIKSFEGRYPVYAAKAMWTNDYLCICISVQYPETAGTHSHNFGNGWLATPAKHYVKCIGCGEVPEAEYHYDSDKSGFCDVCDYNMNYYNPNAPTYEDGVTAGSGTGTATHTHAYSTDWVEDISNHWKQCTGCGAKTSQAAHADLNNTGKCDVCGFVMSAAAGHTHAFATEWTETFAQHYKVCSCGAKNEIAAHVDLNNTGKCDTCGYAMTTLSNNGIVAATGDSNATFLWMAAFAVSVFGLAATVLFARKKREE